jgi:hypothetical protein
MVRVLDGITGKLVHQRWRNWLTITIELGASRLFSVCVILQLSAV